ncbi:MAG: hypothetical protein HY814_01800 [Candidatus Riflebacteria bacterium]|nr:hypothetical protein [Candidatus Riflebacteria bacterium]
MRSLIAGAEGRYTHAGPMVDEKLIEEIVRRVVARLLAAGQLQASAPAPSQAEPPRQGVTHTGRVLTEWDVLLAHRAGKGYITLAKKTIVTPLARDRARDLSVELVIQDAPRT